MQIYEKPYNFIGNIQITLIAKITCPFCKAAKEQLDWFLNSLLKMSYEPRYVGHIHSRLNVGAIQRIDNTSTDAQITQFYHEFLKVHYPGISQMLPLTVIGNLQSFLKYNTVHPSIINGCDRFFVEFSKYPQEARSVLTKKDLEIIKSNSLDGLLYSETLYYEYIFKKTGITDTRIANTLTTKRKVYYNIVGKLRNETIRLNTSQTKNEKRKVFIGKNT